MAPRLMNILAPALATALLLVLTGCQTGTHGYHYRGYGSPGVHGAYENDQGYNVGYKVSPRRTRAANESHYYSQGSYIHGSAPRSSTHVTYTRYEPRGYVSYGIGTGYYDTYHRGHSGFGVSYSRSYGHGSYGHRYRHGGYYGGYSSHGGGHYGGHGGYGHSGGYGGYYCD